MHLPSPPSDSKSFRVLVVEDEADIARLVLVHLQRAGFDARLALDGNLGWQAFRDSDPHLALIDVNMPGMDGWSLAAKIREKSGIPIIMMTAACTDEDQIHGFKIGADDYVSKPFHPPVLLARVIAHLRRVYRYDAPEPHKHEPEHDHNPPAVPDGWSQCDGCGYIGPQFKFEALDPQKGRVFICPNCKQRRLTFSLGNI